jgi:hypothetical protein
MLWQAVVHILPELVGTFATDSRPSTTANALRVLANSLGLKPILSLFGF